MQKPDNWAELTWKEKREKRFEWWRAAHGVNFINAEAKAKHDRRLDRYIKAIKMEELPDRVPIDIAAGSYIAYYAGYDLKTIMYDAEKMKEATLKYARDFDTDTMPMSFASSALVNDLMQPRSSRWPGGGLPDDAAIIQFAEDEYMREEDYDLYFKDPADYILRYFLPRTYGVFEPLSRLGPLESFMGVGQQLMMAAGTPEFKEMAEKLLKAHEASLAWGKVAGECTQSLREMGYPAAGGAMGLAPFDLVADMLRGTHGSVMDMFRRPEQILELAERVLPDLLVSAILMADMSDSPMVFIPMHKGDDMFMSDKQFEKFYWPSYRKFLLGLIEEGLVPAPIIDGTYNRRLEFIKDLPATGVLWTFEKTDMALAKKVLGGHTCIAGNVTGAMMYTHKPEEIKKYCRWLIDTCAPGGGYVLCMGSSLAGWNDPANLHAMIDTGKEYGVYR
jgi:uroporphyrinogen-III decarboxylase